MEAASKLDADEVERLKEVREEVREEVDRILDGGAIFILPTTPGKAPKRGQSDQATESWRRKCFELLCIASLCGLPQVSIPLEAPNIEGPQGLSLIAGYQMDKMLIGAARQIVPALVEAYPDILEAELERLNPPEAPGESEKTKGNEALKQGKYQDAIEYYSVAIGKNPKSKIFVANRAMAHLKLGNYQLAEDDCTQAIKLDARYVKAYLRRAAARSVAGNYLEALMDYEEALRFEPNNSDAKREVYRMKKIIGMADPGMDVGDM
jgi:tetratricopeptide (TPR) repeat protein